MAPRTVRVLTRVDGVPMQLEDQQDSDWTGQFANACMRAIMQYEMLGQGGGVFVFYRDRGRERRRRFAPHERMRSVPSALWETIRWLVDWKEATQALHHGDATTNIRRCVLPDAEGQGQKIR